MTVYLGAHDTTDTWRVMIMTAGQHNAAGSAEQKDKKSK
jgi:hypothetical protein